MATWRMRLNQRVGSAGKIRNAAGTYYKTPLHRKRDSRPTSCSKGGFFEWRTQPLAVPSKIFSAHALISIAADSSTKIEMRNGIVRVRH